MQFVGFDIEVVAAMLLGLKGIAIVGKIHKKLDERLQEGLSMLDRPCQALGLGAFPGNSNALTLCLSSTIRG